MPNAPKAEIEGKYTNIFCQSVQKQRREEKREKRKKGIGKFLCYTNTVNDCKWILLVYEMLACPYNLVVIFIIRRGFTTSTARRGNLQKECVT